MSAQPDAARITEPDPVSIRLVTDPPGRTDYAAFQRAVVAIHVGKSVYMSCRRGGLRHKGLGVHGDIDLVPPGTPTIWEPEDYDTVLAIALEPQLLKAVVLEGGRDPDRLELWNRFQMRDAQMENIGWTLKAEMEAGYPNGQMFRDCLAHALAICIVNRHSSLGIGPEQVKDSFRGHRLKQVLAYIEDNLARELSLTELAAVAGTSQSHCKAIFRQSMGLPLHQYVIQRRVETARTLLCETALPVSEIALQVGFAHQSHLAHHMKRRFGYTPGALR